MILRGSFWSQQPFVRVVVVALASVFSAAVLMPQPVGAATLPVEAPIVDRFRAPEHSYAAGNRGWEFGPGTGVVRAFRGGTISFRRLIAGEWVVVVDHADGLRSTYMGHWTPSVMVGVPVEEGAVIGERAGDRLYFGLRLGAQYVDPARYFGRVLLTDTSSAELQMSLTQPLGVDEGSIPRPAQLFAADSNSELVNNTKPQALSVLPDSEETDNPFSRNTFANTSPVASSRANDSHEANFTPGVSISSGVDPSTDSYPRTDSGQPPRIAAAATIATTIVGLSGIVGFLSAARRLRSR